VLFWDGHALLDVELVNVELRVIPKSWEHFV